MVTLTNIRDSVNNFIDSDEGKVISDKVTGIMITLICIQFLFYMIGAVTGLKSWFISLILLLPAMFSGLIFGKDADDDKVTHIAVCEVLCGGNFLFSIVASALSSVLAGHFFGAMFLILIQAVVIGGILIYLFKKTDDGSDKKVIEPLLDMIHEGMFNFRQPDEYHQGDAILGYDPETGFPNIQPLKDRYVHTQVYGPTGSGKTSQILLPMILKDLQVNHIEADGFTFDSMAQIVLDPKGDLALQVFRMANILGGHDPYDAANPTTLFGKRVYFFDPMLINTPKFNPLRGSVTQATENIVSAFAAFQSQSTQYFQDLGNQLVRNAMKVVKKLKKNDATLLDLETVCTNPDSRGETMVNEFAKLDTANESEDRENQDIVSYFLEDYYPGQSGGQGSSKTYSNSSAVRTILSKLNSNPYLRKTLNPAPGDNNVIDFNAIFRDGDKVALSMNQGNLNTDLTHYLGLFLMLQIQSAITARPLPEASRRPAMFYIDEFQVFANPEFENVLTQGRSYHVGLVVATQTRALLEEKAGTALLQNLSTNARTIITFPGGSPEDTQYFSDVFGSHKEVQVKESVSQAKGGIFSGGGKPATVSRSKDEQTLQDLDPDQIEYGKDIYDIKSGEDNNQSNIMFFRMIKNGIVQKGRMARTKYMPIELHHAIDKSVDFFNQHFELQSSNGKPLIYDPELIKMLEEQSNKPEPDRNKPLTADKDVDMFDGDQKPISNNKSDINAENAVQDPTKVDHHINSDKTDISGQAEKAMNDESDNKSETSAGMLDLTEAKKEAETESTKEDQETEEESAETTTAPVPDDDPTDDMADGGVPDVPDPLGAVTNIDDLPDDTGPEATNGENDPTNTGNTSDNKDKDQKISVKGGFSEGLPF